MKRHKIWYKRKLFKNHFKSYQDWDKYNPPSGDKHPHRYKNEALQCQNPECEREGMLISEHEAFYYFARQSRLEKIKRKIFYMVKKGENDDIYICPFCGKSDIREV